MGYDPQESLENTINTMGTLLWVHLIVHGMSSFFNDHTKHEKMKARFHFDRFIKFMNLPTQGWLPKVFEGCLSVCLLTHLFIYLFLHFCIYSSISSAIYLSIYLLFVYLLIGVFFIYIYVFFTYLNVFLPIYSSIHFGLFVVSEPLSFKTWSKTNTGINSGKNKNNASCTSTFCKFFVTCSK